jgi:HemY protein
MLRLTFFVIVVGAAAVALAWFADQPGTLSIEWLGYQIETSVFVAGLMLGGIVLASVALWSALRYLLSRPAILSAVMKKKREKRGLDALSRGLIAVGAGDKDEARKYAGQAHKLLPGEPLTGLLRSQSAQLHGDRATARQIFETMAEAPETEMLGLRGLFLEARRENESEAARQFAERAMERNPDLAWSVNALFELQCKAGDWAGALRTLDVSQRQKQIEKPLATRRRAVLLTAQAMEAEKRDMNQARQLALEAHKLAPDLVPAAEIAGRVMASQGDATRAARVIAKTWELNPHPDLAIAYAHTRPGESPRERLKRVVFLAQWAPDNLEGAIAVASAAAEARAWEEAREALKPYVGNLAPARVCTLMARIDGGETGDQGRVREWLARAVHAPRDPAWTADGYISDRWAPISPITGELDAFEWKAPVELLGGPDPLVIEDTDPDSDQASPPRVEGAAPAGGDNSGTTETSPSVEAAASRSVPGSPEDELETEIFVPPRAPDDPGPEGIDTDEETHADAKFRAPSG